MSDLALYTYFRSSCSYRVRIALALKKLEYEPRYIHLLRDGGGNWKPEYLKLNPQGLVPTLVDGQRILSQSMAIIEYLDECYPEPPLLPADARDRAYVRALVQVVACDIQPLNNLRVLDYLKDKMNIRETDAMTWYRHWITQGFQAIELLLESHEQAGNCCFADTPTLADISLIPQVYSARRFQCDTGGFPVIEKIYKYCTALPAFKSAAPDKQSDAD